MARTKLVELFFNIIRCKNETISQEVLKLDMMKPIIDLIFQYEWNDIMRNIIEKIFQYIIEGDSTYLQEALFKDNYMIKVFMENTKEQTCKPGNYKKPIVKGYFTHVIKIAGFIYKDNKPSNI